MNRTFILFLLLLVVINIALGVIYYQGKFQGKKALPLLSIQKEDISEIGSSRVTPLPTQRPRPTPQPMAIPHGKTGFTVGVKENPVMRIGFLDPYDPKIGEKQTVSITVKNTNPVESVEATMQTDNQSKKYPMKLVEGTTLDGRWEATWEVGETYLYTYVLTIDAVSGADKSKAIITLR